AALLGGLIDLGIGRFNLAADATPEVKLPGGVEPHIVFVERYWNSRKRGASRGLEKAVDCAAEGAEWAVGAEEGTVYAIELALVLGIAIHGGKCRGGSDASLKAAFCQSNRRCQHIQIFGSDAALEVSQDRIAKHRPPARVRRLLQPWIDGLAGVGGRGQLRSRNEIRAKRAARKRDRKRRVGKLPDPRCVQDAPLGRLLADNRGPRGTTDGAGRYNQQATRPKVPLLEDNEVDNSLFGHRQPADPHRECR